MHDNMMYSVFDLYSRYTSTFTSERWRYPILLFYRNICIDIWNQTNASEDVTLGSISSDSNCYFPVLWTVRSRNIYQAQFKIKGMTRHFRNDITTKNQKHASPINRFNASNLRHSPWDSENAYDMNWTSILENNICFLEMNLSEKFTSLLPSWRHFLVWYLHYYLVWSINAKSQNQHEKPGIHLRKPTFGGPSRNWQDSI